MHVVIDPPRFDLALRILDLDTRDRFAWDRTRIKYEVLEDWRDWRFTFDSRVARDL
jgi:hypothetical protein